MLSTENARPRETRSGSAITEPSDWFEDAWVSRQVEALAAAWERGERVAAAELLKEFPEIGDEAAIRLIYEEVCLRREAGEDMDAAEVLARYPRWHDQLRDLLDCDRLLGPSGRIVACPQVGEALGPFRLLSELGRGASGRTFLATDPSLADRPVVVKVIPGDQDEHLALAQLRHTHIVPLFSEHSFPDSGLRVLCMPYLGGASLAQIQKDLRAVPPARRSGKLLADLIDRNSGLDAAPALSQSPFRRGLEQASYSQAITWVAACLADALHYAHGRGLVHMDVKPSNALITVDGQPMLLDFHLARAPVTAGDLVIDRLGGTPGWMSPEQRIAMDAVNEGRAVPAAIDGRTDIYALGLLMREALAAPDGSHPSNDGAKRQRDLPGVSPGLCDIVFKCTAPDPKDRYDDAGQLAEDLRRHLQDLPLRGVGNRSPVERWGKWRRRHPGALAWGMTGLVVLIAGLSALAGYLTIHRGELATIRSTLEEGRRLNASGRYEEAIRTLQHGLRESRRVSNSASLRLSLENDLMRAYRGRTADEVHNLADQIRYRYGVDLPFGEEARALLENCRVILGARGRLLHDMGRSPSATEPESPFAPRKYVRLDDLGESPRAAEQQRIRTDLLEVAAVWADLRVRSASSGSSPMSRREALALLDELAAGIGPSLALELRRQEFLGAEGSRSAVTCQPPRTAWEYYDRGRHDLRAGRFATAAEAFRCVLDVRPQDFWSNFHQGVCFYRVGRFHDAIAAFRASCALEPRSAICRYNRALAYEALGEADLAVEDYSRALSLDPTLAAALLNRGIVSYQGGRWRQAIADFERGLGLQSVDRRTQARLCYNLALAFASQGDRATALGHAERALDLGSPEAAFLRDELKTGGSVGRPPKCVGSAPSRDGEPDLRRAGAR